MLVYGTTRHVLARFCKGQGIGLWESGCEGWMRGVVVSSSKRVPILVLVLTRLLFISSITYRFCTLLLQQQVVL